ncbi:MAG: DNA-processing protein DprA [Acidobacteriota bacterium]
MEHPRNPSEAAPEPPFPNPIRELTLALATLAKLGLATRCRLVAELPNWHRRPAAEAPALAAAFGVPPAAMKRAMALRPAARERAAGIHACARAAQCTLLARHDDGFPARLRHLSLPPAALWIRGEMPCEGRATEPAVAIVGSRRATHYGLEAATFFAGHLAAAGVTVISGFARGIDTAAHRAALDAGGKTLAVLGCGVDADYPRGSRDFAREVCRRGALVSEFPPATTPRAWHFPVRNRVIAALAQAVLVVEAAPRSGSLITVRHALDLNRDVFAVPGRIFDEGSAGTIGLLRDGAYPAHHPRDILDALPESPQPPRQEPVPDLPGLAGRLLVALPQGRLLTAEQLAETAGVPVEDTLAALMELEIGGWITRRPGPTYGRRR